MRELDEKERGNLQVAETATVEQKEIVSQLYGKLSAFFS